MHSVDKERKRTPNDEAILKSMEKTDSDTMFMYVSKRRSSDLKYMCVCVFFGGFCTAVTKAINFGST